MIHALPASSAATSRYEASREIVPLIRSNASSSESTWRCQPCRCHSTQCSFLSKCIASFVYGQLSHSSCYESLHLGHHCYRSTVLCRRRRYCW